MYFLNDKEELQLNKKISEGVIIGFIITFVIFLSFHVGQLLWGIISVFIIFWLLMLIDCLQRSTENFPYEGKNEKLIWVFTLVLLNIIGSVLYFYLVKLQGIKRNTLNVK